MFKCQNCGGKVIFDIAHQQLKCEYCGSFFKVSDYQQKNDAVTYETNVFVCQSCGAELISPDEQVVSFCSYCGSQSMLPGKLTNENSPKAILPFKITKDQCKEIYAKKFQGIWYLPKEYKDAALIDSMRGIYMPFWSCSMRFPEHTYVKAERREKVSSDSYYLTTYSVDIAASNDKERYQVDASSALDDTITQKLVPFPEKKLVPFQPPYLAGFYADRSDVPVNKYIPYLKQQATEDVLTEARKALAQRSMSLEAGQEQVFRKAFQPQPNDYYAAMMPVWFLTHREKDRVSYAIMNGHDGKMYADMPVDTKRFALVTAIIAVVLFVVLSLFTSVLAKTALGIAALVTGIVALIFKGELKTLKDRETHAYDIGSPFYDGILRSPQKTTSESMSKFASGLLKVLFYLFIIGAASGAGIPVLLSLFDDFNPDSMMGLLSFTGVILTMIGMISGLKSASKIQDKSLALGALLPFLATLAALIVALIHPVDDWWYYLGAIFCFAGALIPCLQLIKCYNEIASRPLPTYFAREGGLNDAK